MIEKRTPEYHQRRILLALESENMSSDDLVPLLDLSISMVQYYLSILRDAPRRVRIAGYRPIPGVGRQRPLYGLGSGPDEPEPSRSRADRHLSQKQRDALRVGQSMTVDQSIALATSRPQEWYSALGI